MTHRLALLAILVLVVAPVVQADVIPSGPVAASDFDPATLTVNGVPVGQLVASSGPDNFETPANDTDCPSCDVGDLLNEVYFDGTVYTYVHYVTPQDLDDIAVFSTDSGILGFNNIAGFDFDGSVGNGGLGGADYTIVYNTVLQKLTWSAFPGELGTFPLDEGETLAFFFQSTLPPTGIGDYNISDGETGTGQSFIPGEPIPNPEPATLLLIGTGLLGAGFLVRRR